MGKLIQGQVIVEQKQAWCILRLVDGASIVGTFELSDEEIAAYHSSPETFFDVVQQTPKKKDPVELHDWFYESYKHNSKEALLKLLAGASDIDALSILSQDELAKVFAERTTVAALSVGHK